MLVVLELEEGDVVEEVEEPPDEEEEVVVVVVVLELEDPGAMYWY